MSVNTDANTRPEIDALLVKIADYVCTPPHFSDLAFKTAHYCLMDTLGCGMLALRFPECRKLLGPIVPQTSVPQGTRVPGTSFCLDPVKAAWDIGTIIRWLDYNDTWLAAEWGHPSDNLGGILAVCDYMSQTQQRDFTVQDVLEAMIQAHEIQGCLALDNSFNRVGLDHVILVKVATCAVVARLIGCSKEQVINALSLAFVDGQALRTYRHAPNTGSRKSWAAGDATSRGVFLALMAKKGEMGYASVLSAPTWGFQDVLFRGQPLRLEAELGSYVMENVLFKIAYPAEFHAQTAVECALQLHQTYKDKIDQVAQVTITTHESAIRIISKTGVLNNPADRDHCLQYMVAYALLFGELTSDSYEAHSASDPRIDSLREKMRVQENSQFSKDYLDPEKRSIANAIAIQFKDGTQSESVEVHYPLGHSRRREEGIPLLKEKFINNIASRFSQTQCQKLEQLLHAPATMAKLPLRTFVDHWLL